MASKFAFGAVVWLVAMIALMAPGIPVTCPERTHEERSYSILIRTRGNATVTLMTPSQKRTHYHALACSVLLSTGALFGLAGVWVCDAGREVSVGMAAGRQPGASWRLLLSQMPATISEAIHDPKTAHGTAFKALMFLLALLLMVSFYPEYEMYGAGLQVTSSNVLYNTFRSITPTAGICLLIFIPSNASLQRLMDDKLTKPGYQVTPADKELFLMSELQTQMHAAGGVISFVLSTLLEFVALHFSVICGFFTAEPEGEMVQWSDQNISSYIWLALAVTRCFILLSIPACLMRFAYETEGEPSKRCRWQNPNFSYIPEKQVITQLASSVLALATSICFVNRRAWETMPVSFKIVLVISTIIEIIGMLYVTINTFRFVICIESCLSDDKMRSKIEGYVNDYNKQTDSGHPAMQRLAALQARMLLRHELMLEYISADEEMTSSPSLLKLVNS